MSDTRNAMDSRERALHRAGTLLLEADKLAKRGWLEDRQASADKIAAAETEILGACPEYGHCTRYSGHGSAKVTDASIALQTEIDHTLDTIAARTLDPAVIGEAVDLAESMAYDPFVLECKRILAVEILARADARPAHLRGSRCRQLPVSSAHASHPCPGGVEHVRRGRFGAVVHPDGYVFGTRLAYRKRIRDGVEKRILMVVA